ncbi:hypothetical protein P3X46_012534 [Hevea brasiliensis]|uniref:B-like cyclin n=1 Tax=Hevea brasiliensis TaxID=3981 RepID=A0ABQ9MCN0_HEVBR|nr:cyclin-D3-2 [Hevea brasiliensis]KAJ9177300.1 hypothetical protein P3X46_012534 [Hevea brasiliensis]
MALHLEEDQQLFNPAFVFDGLYCEEQGLEGDYVCGDNVSEVYDQIVRKESPLSRVLFEQDLFWEDDELLALFSKEKETHICFDNVVSDGSLMTVRKEAIDWVLRVKAYYGFTALTGVLAVNYFDRFISTLKFPRDKPWLSQLTAVACLSLAAKVEETQVPLLLDLQVEESKYVFEAKTIKRMELLVLSTLQWRMNPVTPISFFDHIIRRLGLKNQLHWEFLRKCERLLLSVISDLRFMNYLPSTLATAAMLHVIKEVEPCNQVEYQHQLMSVIKIHENKVNECYKLILELSGCENRSCKRKYLLTPSSPNGVIDAYLSCGSSTVSSSSVSRFKKSRTQDQQMRLPSVNRMFVDFLSSPH